MKHIHFSFLIVLFFSFALIACQSKEEKVISNVETLAENIEADGETYDEDKWQEIAQDVEKLSNEAKECEFTQEQRERYGKAYAKLTVAFVKQGAKAIGEGLSNLLDYSKGYLEGLEEEYGDDVKNLGEKIQDAIEDIDEDEVEDALENARDKLNEASDKLNDLYN